MRNYAIFSLSDIDLCDETYRYKYECNPTVEKSVATNGVLQPVLGVRGERGIRVVDGFSRLRAAHLFGIKRVVVSLLPGDERGSDEKRLFMTALAANTGTTCSELAISRALHKALYLFKIEETAVRDEIAPLLGLNASLSVIREYAIVQLFPEQVKSYVESGALSFRAARLLAGLNEDALAAWADTVLPSLRLSASQTKQVFAIIYDIMRRENKSFRSVITSGRIESFLRERGEKNKYGADAFCRFMQTLLRPEYDRMEKRFADIKKNMVMPKHGMIEHAPFFETDTCTISFPFHSATSFRDGVGRLSSMRPEDIEALCGIGR